MAITKIRKYFDITQYEEEAAWLREMSNKGLRFVSVGGFASYTFEQCAPEDVIYQLDYNTDALKDADEYRQMFEDCGWEYLQDYVGYSYFRKPAAQAEADGSDSIFCDQASRLEMMDRVFKSKMLPILAVFCLCLVPSFLHILYSNYYIPGQTILMTIYVAFLAIYVYMFTRFARGMKRLKEAAGE